MLSGYQQVTPRTSRCLLLLITFLSILPVGRTQVPPDLELSPLKGWEDVPPPQPDPPLLLSIISWLPDRLADAWDIFRVDVGAGPAIGGTIRATRYLQASYRHFDPGSLRVGAMGRRAPVMWEHSTEEGFSPINFQASTQRDVCTYEIGIGIEIGAGAYLGICPEEAVDFIAGIFFLDSEDDDCFAELF